jgi:hypothetical protein
MFDVSAASECHDGKREILDTVDDDDDDDKK